MFYDPAEFPIANVLTDNWEIIRDEYLALEEDAFDPWVQRGMHGAGWSVFGLVAAGHAIPGSEMRCPKTQALLAGLEGISLAGFSRMAPHSHILPHCGWAENEYRLHLGLVVPDGCRLRVAEETRNWQPGKCLVFDDTIEHEAWNDSGRFRGNLMVDFLRPGETEFSNRIPEDVRRYAEGLFEDGRQN